MTVTMNPYEVLGLPRDAEHKAIRAAYRRLSKRHHPDSGGDAIRFAELKLAHDILLDDARRAKFDSTGDTSETTPDNTQAEILAHLSVALQTVVCQHHTNIKNVDLIALMRSKLSSDLNALRQEIAQMRSTMAIWSLTLGRIHAKEGKPNFLADMCQTNIKAIQARIPTDEKRMENIQKAIAMLNDFSYDKETKEYGKEYGHFSGSPDLYSSLFGEITRQAWQKAGF